MSALQIRFENDVRNFKPGEALHGTVTWELPQACQRIEVRLYWATDGVGTPESGLIEATTFEQLQASETRPFTFQLPAFPYSYEGAVSSLNWMVEAVVFPGKQTVKETIIMGPEARLILLPNAARTITAAA